MTSAKVPPARLVRAVERARHHVRRLWLRSVPPEAAMLELLLGAWLAQGITAAAQLGVADALSGGPLRADELARRVGADADALDRLMRALVGEGVFRRTRDGRYALNPLGDTLRTDAQVSMAGMAKFVGAAQHREHWSHLADAVRTGESAIRTLRGMEPFDYIASQPELGTIFNDAMTSMSELAITPLIAAYDFTRFGTIADVGGGHGRLLSAILGSAPQAKGVLYDLPNVVEGAPEMLARHGVADRVQVVPGSFFDEVPDGADLYVMKNIIHDWADAPATEILRNVRAAARTGATLLLVEGVIPDHDRAFPLKWVDMEMLIGNAARERTEAQYRKLYTEAGFRLTRVVPTACPYSLIEGVAV
ncbi:acetylserotonin O-methyltransferase [Mycolicibacterium smegmatis]|uniref:methyltransferase n=1 Tax=Mycolicibacterium smegmatis TaxID=1772 RepID=UPI00071AFA3C|nr:methyltransferase [Mycolicibacterium smegmatis]MDF1903670.1 methyltransferase [Mycolicibacterium smegmatis]MDF1910198.1 methyltransferase [Mycolicibacterium smegmatis]MDF1916661.1 methyltransferase [Mycolicibacterium smegmatis]MDF1927024.1 methyltransferase [Mycolicibacterium smegmatis]UAK52643.1 hydroxyneurosporene methyltransferase [Mycolicibacterium smegmatis]